jgi:opacity protein-like surface antigen
MKKLFTIAVAVAVVLACTALKAEGDKSVGKKDWLVGAAADFNRIWGGGIDARNTFTLSSEVGYFIWDFLMPEAKIDIGITEGYDSEIFTAGARGYWNKKTQLLPYARLNMGVGTFKIGSRYTKFVLNPGIGVDYLLTKNVAIGLQVNYQAFISGSFSHRFDIPIGFSIYF